MIALLLPNFSQLNMDTHTHVIVCRINYLPAITVSSMNVVRTLTNLNTEQLQEAPSLCKISGAYPNLRM